MCTSVNRTKAHLVILSATQSSLPLGAIGLAPSARYQQEFLLSAPQEQVKKPANRAAKAQPAPDFETYRQHVEPIFLKRRPGYARCYSCHALSNRVFHLEPLSPGATDWSAEQSQKRVPRDLISFQHY
jgi:hypothetical protein